MMNKVRIITFLIAIIIVLCGVLIYENQLKEDSLIKSIPIDYFIGGRL